ncbi:SGNH/GDSL hydrolase family protein [Gordonia hydrophobica]|uniref:SGNH/GDSL hydrolase family protein n=1 Tax=Gordonia hydrophobica TaxID=40516 RepID=A0ABZ2U5T5_9ACTN|nr:SGNH/GDSL hydrolase family protein [Gordonia hydrophobica]MBM7365627.1 lysophospholipase L1-like esterase [Gordonia hydrophobica]
MRYSRFVAIGDSQTEGMGDGDAERGYRGWADRLAEHLAANQPDFRYANLAVRGKNTRDVLTQQLEPAVALRPDLIAAPLGMNDVIGRIDLDDVHADLDVIYRRLAETGAEVIVSTFPDISEINPFGRVFQDRLLDMNGMMRDFARDYGFVLVDLYAAPVLRDRRSWSRDRLHASSAGHERFAAGAAFALGLPEGAQDWGSPLPPRSEPNRIVRIADDARWLMESFSPWIIRKMRGRSLGDGRLPKRAELLPVASPGS